MERGLASVEAAGAAGKGPAILAKAAAEGSGTEGSVEAAAERKETETVVALAVGGADASGRYCRKKDAAPWSTGKATSRV